MSDHFGERNVIRIAEGGRKGDGYPGCARAQHPQQIRSARHRRIRAHDECDVLVVKDGERRKCGVVERRDADQVIGGQIRRTDRK